MVRRRVVRAIKRQASAVPWRAQIHEATGDCDLPHPCAQWRLAAERVEPLEHGHHRVLEKVLGQRAIADDAPYEPVHRGGE